MSAREQATDSTCRQDGRRVRVLALQEQSSVAALVIDELARGGFVPEWTQVETEREFTAALSPEIDLILSDLILPEFSAARALECLFASGFDIPFIVVTGGATNEGLVVDCLKRGACDYVHRDRLARLPAVAARALEQRLSRAQQQRAEAARRQHEQDLLRADREVLARSEERFRELFMNNLTGAYVSTPAGELLACNPEFVSTFGFGSIDEARQADVASLWDNPKDRQEFLDDLRSAGRVEYREMKHRRRDGNPVYVLETAVGAFDSRGSLVEIRGYMRDLSQQKSLEDQLRQAQKMEAIGQLAGGIAHDFNNLLTAILGHCELALGQIADAEPLKRDVSEIKKAGDRAATLVRQLLGFSRKQIIQPEYLDLNAVVHDIHAMLNRLVREDVSLTVGRTSDLAMVKVDRSQVSQILVNLVVNAADAMPLGGQIAIETENTLLDRAFVRQHVGSVEGRYVALSVSDTGCGMSPDTQAHIFEPFYTTKEYGKGTGLGLAMVYGIVQQNGGYITVDSAVGRGTTFRIFIPVATEPPEVESRVEAPPLPVTGSRTILLVEDEQSVREFVRRSLERQGYVVLEAGGPQEAESMALDYPEKIDLLITDVGMPGMNGPELAQRVIARRQKMKVLFMSGHGLRMEPGGRWLSGNVRLLQKPFGQDALARMVREALSA